jgi:hypothetical protein
VEPIGERLRIRRLEAPGFRHAIVRPNTVVGVDPKTGQLLRTNEGGVIQDDSNQLKLLAQRLYQWQKVPRYAVGVSSTWIDGRLAIGRLLTALADVAGTSVVNTVLTEITLAFPVTAGSQPQLPRCTIATAFAELDPQRIV